MKTFQGRVAVVTGGASGIGKALAKAFVAEGMKVVLADVEKKALDACVAELSRGGAKISGVVTDVSRQDSVEALADQVFAEHGACHVLCNNAGVGAPSAPVWETTPNDWKWVHGVNVMGVVHGIHAFVPRMLESGEEGVVVNTSSGDGGIQALPDQSVYASSKAAVSVITECLGAQLAAQEGGKQRALLY
jgi:NAD(P)-dependent dehydrogenase (short-subunit alcohol dehydrogenase family)